MKATKLTLAAVLLAGTCGFAMAQGGAGGEGPKGRQSAGGREGAAGETKSAPVHGAQAPAATGSQQVQNPPHRRLRAPRPVQRVIAPARVRT